MLLVTASPAWPCLSDARHPVPVPLDNSRADHPTAKGEVRWALWVARVTPRDLATPHKDRVIRIDLAYGRVVATITVGRAPGPGGHAGAVWVPNSGGGGDSVARINSQTNRLAGHPVRTGASAWR